MSSAFSNHEIGVYGEQQCVKYIKKYKKYKVLDKNSTIGHLETDIIAYNKEFIIFIEVKTRHIDSKNSPRPADAVDKNKRSNLLKFAYTYMKTCDKKFSSLTPRIDVCEIWVEGDKKLKVSRINYIENAISR